MQPPLFAPLPAQPHHLSEIKRRSESTPLQNPLSAAARRNGHNPYYLNGNISVSGQTTIDRMPSTQQSTATEPISKCMCCPYGDGQGADAKLDSLEKSQTFVHIPFEPIGADSNNVTSSGYGLDSSVDERSAMNNSMFDSSILSKSMDEGHSDLEDILVQHPDMLSSKYSATPSTPISILKHRSDSNVPRVIRQNGESPSQNHQSRLKLHEQRSFIASPPTSRRYNNGYALPTIMSTATSADTFYNNNNVKSNTLQQSHLPPMPIPLRSSTPLHSTSTPSKNVNDEIQQILSTQKQFHPNNIYATINSGRSIALTSAPTSPVPKTFYTATAQSISQLKKLSLPKSPSAIHAALNASNSLGKSRQTPLQSSGSGTAGAFAYNYTLSSTQPPRRYLEGAYRHRVISPEPEAQAYQRFTPTVLRNSNLQSRQYYHTLGGMSSSSSNQMPYRYKGGKTTSSLLDMDSFASVRRRKVDDVSSGANFGSSWADSPTSSTAGSNKWRSASQTDQIRVEETPQRSSSAPKWKHQDFQEVPISNGHSNNGGHEYRKDSFTRTTDHFAAKDSGSAFTTLLQMNGVENVNPQVNFTISNKEAEVESIFYNSGTQTEALPSWKSISVGTDSSLLESLLNTYKKTATPPPAPPVLVQTTSATATPKPSRKDIIASVPTQRLEVEFQYCLGHEPEYRQGEEPAHLLASLAERDVTQKPSSVETGCDSIQFLSETKEICTSTTNLINYLVQETSTESKQTCSLAIQTEDVQQREPSRAAEVECQTDDDWLEEQVAQRFMDEKANKRKSVDKVTETDDEEASEFIMITCAKCDRSSASSAGELYEKIVDYEGSSENEVNHLSTSLSNNLNQNNSPRDSELTAEDEGLELVDGLPDADLDTISIETDVQTVINVADQQGQSRQLDPSRAEAIRKLLTEPQRRQQSNFQRDSGNYRSYRTEKSKADDLDYITDRHFNKNDTTEPSTPSSDSKMALKEMVQLKKPLPNLLFLSQYRLKILTRKMKQPTD
uniref:Uncharacterized protein n=1 Tax=Ditylenchus dipsaci TaxID=166011 RepID=A0A915D5I5_9BILA